MQEVLTNSLSSIMMSQLKIMCCQNSNLMTNIKQKERVIFQQFLISPRKLLINQEDNRNKIAKQKTKALTIKIEIEVKVKVLAKAKVKVEQMKNQLVLVSIHSYNLKYLDLSQNQIHPKPRNLFTKNKLKLSAMIKVNQLQNQIIALYPIRNAKKDRNSFHMNQKIS